MDIREIGTQRVAVEGHERLILSVPTVRACAEAACAGWR
jgi:hypothetical protein